jgi:hypothetical protein
MHEVVQNFKMTSNWMRKFSAACQSWKLSVAQPGEYLIAH